MCRLVLMNKAGEKEIEREYGLANYFKYLENKLGGNGNGFALLKNGRIIKMDKGVKLDVRDIAKEMKKTEYDWAIFHTRHATIGEVSDKNCHPFSRGNITLAMNGTENSITFISKITDMTDTETILDVLDKYHLGITALKNLKSIFMGFYNGKPFVVANNTYNIKMLKGKRDDAIVFASAFPSHFLKNIYVPSQKFLWNGEKIPNIFTKLKNYYDMPRYIQKYRYLNNTYYDQLAFNELYLKGGL